jgi:hypothetical protein
VNSNQVIRYTVNFAARWTTGALLFGSILEAILSFGRQPYRLEIPLMIGLAVFGLSLSGSILALCLMWLLRRR